MAKTCPNCGTELKKQSTTTSGNAKFITWACDGCTHKKTECLGVQ